MENNVYDRLAILYGDKVMIEALESGPTRLNKLMEQDGLSYTEIRARLNVICNNEEMLNDPSYKGDKSETERLEKGIKDSYKEIDDQLNLVMEKRMQNTVGKDAKTQEAMTKQVYDYAKFSNATKFQEFLKAIKNKYPGIKFDELPDYGEAEEIDLDAEHKKTLPEATEGIVSAVSAYRSAAFASALKNGGNITWGIAIAALVVEVYARVGSWAASKIADWAENRRTTKSLIESKEVEEVKDSRGEGPITEEDAIVSERSKSKWPPEFYQGDNVNPQEAVKKIEDQSKVEPLKPDAVIDKDGSVIEL